jgi:hypothetical protein
MRDTSTVEDIGEVLPVPENEDKKTWNEYLQLGGSDPQEREMWEREGLVSIVTGKDNPNFGKVHEAFARLGEINGWEPDTEPPFRLAMVPVYRAERNSENDPARSVFSHTKVILEPQWGGITRGGLRDMRGKMLELVESVSSR